jgi:hypothetical protein
MLVELLDDISRKLTRNDRNNTGVRDDQAKVGPNTYAGFPALALSSFDKSLVMKTLLSSSKAVFTSSIVTLV